MPTFIQWEWVEHTEKFLMWNWNKKPVGDGVSFCAIRLFLWSPQTLHPLSASQSCGVMNSQILWRNVWWRIQSRERRPLNCYRYRKSRNLLLTTSSCLWFIQLFILSRFYFGDFWGVFHPSHDRKHLVCFSLSIRQHPFITNAKPVTNLLELIRDAMDMKDKKQQEQQRELEEDDWELCEIIRRRCVLVHQFMSAFVF